MTAANCLFAGNASGRVLSTGSDGGAGGGIYNAGAMSLAFCVFTNNCTSPGTWTGHWVGSGGWGGAILNAGNAVLEACAVYGRTSAYGASTPTALVGDGLGFVPATASADGLVPGTTCHFRLVASNQWGQVCGQDLAANLPPGAASVPGDSDANGLVDQHELDVVLSNYWMHCTNLFLTNPAGLGKASVSFALTNSPAWNLSVLVSTDLVNWAALPTPACPSYQFDDPAATNGPMRYYRLRWP